MVLVHSCVEVRLLTTTRLPARGDSPLGAVIEPVDLRPTAEIERRWPAAGPSEERPAHR